MFAIPLKEEFRLLAADLLVPSGKF